MKRLAPLALAFGLAGCVATLTPEQKACLDKWGADYRAAVSEHDACLVERIRVTKQWAACIDLENAKPKAQRRFDYCGPRPPGNEFCGQHPGQKPEYQTLRNPCGV